MRLEDNCKARRNSSQFRGKHKTDDKRDGIGVPQPLSWLEFAWEPREELGRALEAESSAFPCSSLLPGAVVEFSLLFCILPLLLRNSDWMFEVAVFPEHGESLSFCVCG